MLYYILKFILTINKFNYFWTSSTNRYIVYYDKILQYNISYCIITVILNFYENCNIILLHSNKNNK